MVKKQVVEGAGRFAKRPLDCGQGKVGVGCWTASRAAREGEETQVRGCLLAAPHLAGRPEERNAGSQAPTQSF